MGHGHGSVDPSRLREPISIAVQPCTRVGIAAFLAWVRNSEFDDLADGRRPGEAC